MSTHRHTLLFVRWLAALTSAPIRSSAVAGRSVPGSASHSRPPPTGRSIA
ncbi:hypothetical protein [Streptomyces sp. NPDC002324]